MVASKQFYILLLLGIFIFALAWWQPIFKNIGLVYDITLLVVFVIDAIISYKNKYISAARSVSERLSIGQDNIVKLEIFNLSNNTFTMLVRDDFPASIETDISEFSFTLNPGARLVLQYTLTPYSRGLYKFGNINLRYLSKLGLLWLESKINANQSIRVYSDLNALQKLSVKLSHSSELGDMHLRKRGYGTEFASLREYAVGDDPRKIDWKASARKDRPVVRVYEIEQEQTVMVLLDAGRMMVSDLEGLRRFDHALNAALALVLTGLWRNDQVALGVFADKPLLYFPPRRGKSHFTQILEATCDIQPRIVEPDYVGALSYFAAAHKQRSLVVVITDLTDPTGSQNLLTGLANLTPRHLPFCVTLQDRRINQIANNINLNTESIFKRAVAIDLIAQRELALAHLVRRGCLILDCPPKELSEKLVDKYLEVKMRGRL
jgi:uncharacterized protein (DUF58 family)